MVEEQEISNTGGENQDRISALPDALKHEILAHLDMRDVVLTSILSNTWRYIWVSTPYLDFDLDYWVEKCYSITSFMKFVENVFTRRGNSDKISKFRLYSYDHEFDFHLPLVSSWISKCLDRSVEHLILRFPLGFSHCDNFTPNSFLPHNLFSSNVKTLEISFCPDPIAPLPVITPASMIKNLYLHGVKLPDGNADGELKLSFISLEDLTIHICDVYHLKVLSIYAPLLEKLRLCLRNDTSVTCRNVWPYLRTEEKACKVKVKIFTPKLRSLSLATFSSEYLVPVDYVIEDDLLSLVQAYIHICADEYDADECSQSLIKILHKVYNARVLELSISTKQVLTDFPLLLEGFPYHFQNLRYIMLVDRMKVPCLQGIINFVLSFPRMETLVWERSWRRWDVVSNGAEESVVSEAEELGSNLPFQSVFSCLKTVELHNLKGTKIELKFLAFLLERAICMDEMIIEYDQLLPSEELIEFKEKIVYLPQASSNVSVSFRVNS